MSENTETKQMTLLVQWGGYYVSKHDNKFNVFRLIDFNKDAYHIQSFAEEFDEVPSFEQVKSLRPFIMHVPISVGGLLNEDEPVLIGSEVLEKDSLSGYREYLNAMGVEQSVIDELEERLIAFSTEEPLQVQLTKVGDEVDISVK